MELRKFVSESIIQIANGVADAFKDCTTAEVSPFEKDGYANTQKIKFNVSVAVEHGAGGKINVLGYGGGNYDYDKTTIQKIDFDVDIKFLPGKTPKQ